MYMMKSLLTTLSLPQAVVPGMLRRTTLILQIFSGLQHSISVKKPVNMGKRETRLSLNDGCQIKPRRGNKKNDPKYRHVVETSIDMRK